MPDSTLPQLCEVIAEVFVVDPTTLTENTVAADVDGWDSVTHTILMLELERRFAIELPLEATYRLHNLGELADFIAARRGAVG